MLSSRAMDPLYLRTIRGEAVERAPVWIMRQAGRYMPEYRALRARHDFLTLCKTPELAAEVTLQPIGPIGVDVAILFADILLPLEAMGAELLFVKGDGPTFPDPVRRREDFGRLRRPDVERDLGYVYEALRTVRGSLPSEVALMGFGGTPWTLAAYLVEGGGSKHFGHLLGWSYRDPTGLAELLEKIADTSLDYLLGQVEAGAQGIQLFDTWGGLLDLDRWRELALPPLQRILDGLGGKVPLTYYIRGSNHLMPALKELPVQVLSVDWRQPLTEARAAVGPDRALQGNLDPAALLGTPEAIEAGVAKMLENAAGGPHVANLGHGILPMTPVENAQTFVAAVKRLSRRS